MSTIIGNIKSVKQAGWDLIVNLYQPNKNGTVSIKSPILAGPHTWFVLNHRPGHEGVFEEFIDEIKALGCNSTRLWYGFREGNEQQPVKYKEFTTALINRAVYCVEYMLERNMIPVLDWMTYYDKQGWELTSKEMADIANLCEATRGLPLLWGGVNEIPGSAEALAYMTDVMNAFEANDPDQRPILINSGFGTGGASESQLRNLLPNGYAIFDGTTWQRGDGLIGWWDTDHSAKYLNITMAEVPQFKSQVQAYINKGIRIFHHMRAWEGFKGESVLNIYNNLPVNDPHLASHQPIAEYLGSIATQFDPKEGGEEVPPPTGEWVPPVTQGSCKDLTEELKMIFYKAKAEVEGRPEMWGEDPLERNARTKTLISVWECK